MNSNLEDKVNQACIEFDIHTNHLILDPITNDKTDADHFQKYTPKKLETKAPNISMTRNTRKKIRTAQDITDFIRQLELTTTEEKVEILTLSMKQLELYDLFQF